jgi:hypothetical protein
MSFITVPRWSPTAFWTSRSKCTMAVIKVSPSMPASQTAKTASSA